MGCSASKNNVLFTKNSPEEPSPSSSSPSSLNSRSFSHSSPKVPRALSLPTPLVHHPPARKGDTHHLVSLTSTTYGSLLIIDHPDDKGSDLNGQDCSAKPISPAPITINKTSSLTADPGDSLSPDSVINTWELMDGLDEDSDFDPDKPNSLSNGVKIEFSSKPSSFQHTGYDGSMKKLEDSYEFVSIEDAIMEDSSVSSSKPLWKHLSEESLLSKMDPIVVSSYRRALSSRQLGSNLPKVTKSVCSSPVSSSFSNRWLHLPGTENRIVVYFTSLRGIRKTYEDCCSVRMIFRGFRVAVDERDISMDSTYRKELQTALGGKAISLPQVFIRGNYIGGAEEIRQLNENGELAKLLKGFPVQDPGYVCEGCGDARFVPCPHCNGSRKVFGEEELVRRCPDCNENGLLRCPTCCS